MKASQREFAGAAPRAAQGCGVFFLCGPDEASVQDAAGLIASLLPDAGERVEMTGAELRRDPVRLGDEARSSSLFGGSRHIWVRSSGEEAHDAIANLIASDVPFAPVVVQAPGATDKGKTAKLLERREDALVAMFYPPDLRSVTDAVRRMADGAGLRMTSELAEQIARAAGLDTRLAQGEVTKLALYLDADPQRPRTADAAAFAEVGARTEEEGMMQLVNAALGGDGPALAGELRRMAELGLNGVAVLLACERRAAQLAQMAARLGPGGDVRAFVAAERQARRIFWKDEADIARQLRIWRGRALERLAERLLGLHRALLANSQSADLLLAQGLTEIARVAARAAG